MVIVIVYRGRGGGRQATKAIVVVNDVVNMAPAARRYV